MNTAAKATSPVIAAPSADPFYYGWRDVMKSGPNGETICQQIPLTLEDALHPQQGDVIVEDSLHDLLRDYLADVCRSQTADDPTALVLSDCGIYWDIPELRHHCPDVSVIFGVRRRRKVWPSFFVGTELTRPYLLVELVSPNTRKNDVETKFHQYHQARVPRYVIIDRLTAEGPWQLRGYRYSPQEYLEMPKDEHGRLWLEEIKIWLEVEGQDVRCIDGVTGQVIGQYVQLRSEVKQLQAASEEQRAQLAAERLRADEAIARADEAKARAGVEKTRAEQEKARANEAQARAVAEAEARQAAEQRQRELEAELARLRGQPDS